VPLSSVIAMPKKRAPTPENYGCSFETSVNSNPGTQRHISEDLSPKKLYVQRVSEGISDVRIE